MVLHSPAIVIDQAEASSTLDAEISALLTAEKAAADRGDYEAASGYKASRESKALDRFLGERWDYVVTVCDSANEACPVLQGAAHRVHWSFDDPSRATGTDAERLATFRRVRDEIATRLRDWLAAPA